MGEAATMQVHAGASINIRAVVLPRATWAMAIGPDGRPHVTPRKGTWFGHVMRSSGNGILPFVVPMLACPNCGGLILLSHSRECARVLVTWRALPEPRVIHQIDALGKVAPDIQCMQPRCDFHRTVYLDRWNKTKPLWSVAYTEGADTEIKFAYSHSVDAKEARLHLGPGDFHIIASGKAIGLFVNDKIGRVVSAD